MSWSTITERFRFRARRGADAVGAGRITLAALPLLLTVAAAAPAGAQRRDARVPLPAPVRAALQSEIRRLLDSAGVASLAVAVARDGVVLWEEGFGYADLERRVPATATTLYSLASISKPFTATAVMQLVEQGRVQLDRPVDDYLGGQRLAGLAGDRAGATVRRVLSHTAGLPLHYRFFYAGDSAAPDVPRTIERYGRIVFPPGDVYSYSNLGFGILGEVVAHVAGTSYETYMRDKVFRPLGLMTTTVGTGAGLANSAVRYDSRQRPIPFYDFDHRGASAVYSSAHELVRFGMFHLKTTPRDAPAGASRLLADSTIDLMQRVATPGDTVNGYGLGWGVDEALGIRRIQHTGGMPGVSTVLSLYPTERVAVVVLSNQSTGLVGRVAADIAAAVLPPSFGTALAARRATPAVASAFAAPAELRGEWRGTVRTYEGTMPLVLRIDSSEVRVRLGDRGSLWTLLNDAEHRGGMIGGRFLGTIPTADARRVAHVVTLQLQLRNGTMRGWVAATATAETNDYSLSSYAELTRTAASAGGGADR
jgi:CubicO group peptidase (beta-lactamase class C family)